MNRKEIVENIKAYYVNNDINKIIDYITNLQEENDKLKLNHKQLSDIEKIAISNSTLIQENK